MPQSHRRWCEQCRTGRDPADEYCPECGTALSVRPSSPEFPVVVFGGNDLVIASHVAALLRARGIPAEHLARPDVYFGALGRFYPRTQQVLVPATEARRHAEAIREAIAEVEAELVLAVPSEEATGEESTAAEAPKTGGRSVLSSAGALLVRILLGLALGMAAFVTVYRCCPGLGHWPGLVLLLAAATLLGGLFSVTHRWSGPRPA